METNLLVKTYLKRLRLPAIARDLEKISAEATAAHLPYDRLLLSLLEQEVLMREQNTLRLRLRQAAFPVLKTFDTFDFSALPALPKAEVLRLAQGEYISQARNVGLFGNPGTGKTHLAIALGVSACRQGYRVRFFTAAGLVNLLREARAQHRLTHLERQLRKADLVILDEFGYVPFSREGADLLFGFCAERYERASLLITSNLEFQQWPEVLGDARLTAALVDRLIHRASIFTLVGESYRFRQAQARQQGLPAPPEPAPLTPEQITPAVAPQPTRPRRRRGTPVRQPPRKPLDRPPEPNSQAPAPASEASETRSLQRSQT